jgi:hypothetical protein
MPLLVKYENENWLYFFAEYFISTWHNRYAVVVHEGEAGEYRHRASGGPGSNRRGRDRQVANGLRLLTVPHTLPTHHHSPLQHLVTQSNMAPTGALHTLVVRNAKAFK